MAILDALLGTAIRSLKAQLAGSPEVSPIIVLVNPDGSYQWTSYGKNGGQLTQVLARIIEGLAINQQPAIYTCSACSNPGQLQGTPPKPGWAWTPSGAFLCPACREELGEPAQVLHLVPPSPEQGATGPAAAATETEPPDTVVDILDEPDLAQAPSNFGAAPVPLFLDGEEEF